MLSRFTTSIALFGALLLAAALPAAAQTSAATGKTELLWLGQAGFRIKTPGGKTIVIDPWITGGPKAPAIYKADLSALGKIDLLLVTHAHVDHLGDAPALAKLNNTMLYGPADMITPLITLGIIPANLGYRFNKSGTIEPQPGIKVTPVKAEHSSLANPWATSSSWKTASKSGTWAIPACLAT
jgi:L-ascorbate metabolism protein UlaG (beta-lactamase superfamily)